MAGPIRIAILANGRQARAEATQTAAVYTRMGRSLAKLGAGVGLVALTSKAIGFAKASVDLEAKYSQTMNTIQASSGASEKAMTRLNDLAIKLGQDTSFSANDAANAMLELSKAGITTRNIMGGGVAGTLQLAAAGGTELGTAATIASNAMNAFNLAGKDMDRIAAALAGGANASTASVESLGQALSQVGPGAVNAGLSLNETVAALSAFDSAGVKGSDAGTSLKTMLARLVPQTDKAATAMEQLGLDFVKGNGQFESLENIAGQLQKRLSDLSQAQRTTALNTIFGSDASRAATVLMKEGTDGIRKFIKATEDQNAAQKMADARMSGTAGALERLSGSVETAQLRLGQELAPVVQKAADGLAENLVPAMDAGIDAAKELGNALAPAVKAVAGALGDLIPDADTAASIFHDDLIPAIRTLSDLVAGAVGFIDDLPGPIKEIGVQAGIAALVFPRLATGVGAATTKMKDAIIYTRVLAAEMQTAEGRSRNLGTVMGKLGGIAKSVAGVGGMVALTQASQQSNDAMSILLNTLGGAATGFALGGPIGALIGGAGGGLLGLYQAAQKADDEATSFKEHWAGVADTLDQVTGATTEATRAFVYDELVRSGALKTLNAYGIASRTAVGAVLGEKKARQQVSLAISSERAQRRAALTEAAKLQKEYNKVVGPGTAEENKRQAIARLIQAYKDEAAEHGAVIKDVRKGIGTLREDVKATRAKARASQELAGKLKVIPKRVRAKIMAEGIQPTIRGVAKVARQYHLVDRKKIRALIQAAGVDGTVKQVRRVLASLNSVKGAKGDISKFTGGVKRGADEAAKAGKHGGDETKKGLEKGPGEAKANLSGYTNSVRQGVGPARAAGASGGQSVGVALKAGIIAGFSGTQAALVAQAAAAVRAAVAAAKHAGQIHSPSRVMRDEVGAQLGEGLVRGLRAKQKAAEHGGRDIVKKLLRGADKGLTGVKQVIDRITKRISDRLDGKKQAARRKALLHSLADERRHLVANGKAQDQVTKRLDKAEEKYKSLRRAADAYAASIKAGFRDYGSVVGLGTTGGGSAVTLPAILSQLSARANVADQFASVIESLRGKLNKTSLKQLLQEAASGDLEGALATAQAITSGGRQAISQINTLTAQIGATGAKVGKDMRATLYRSGLRAADGVVEGLEKRQRKLDKVADRFARQMVRQVSRELHVKAPKINTSQTHASRTPTMDRLVRDDRPMVRGGDTHVKIEVNVPVGADPVKTGRELVKAVDAYFGAGGRTKTRWAGK